MTERIYIIVPVYNAAQYLPECLESIRNQSYQDFICVMVNDGSTDGSKEICESYASDKRFVLISQENRGVASARNTGLRYVLEHAEDGEFLTFIDSDDFVAADYLRKFADAKAGISNQDEETMYICSWKQLMADGKILEHKQDSEDSVISGDFRSDFVNLDSFLQTLWANFYSISLIKEKHIGFDGTLKRGEDIYFNFTYAYFVKRYVFINEFLYNYREIPTSLSRTETQTSERMDMRLKNFERRVHFLNDCGIPNRQLVLNKHISNLVTGSLSSPYRSRLSVLKKYSDWRLSHDGQRRVLFCFEHNILWIYRLYMKCKAVLGKQNMITPPPYYTIDNYLPNRFISQANRAAAFFMGRAA